MARTYHLTPRDWWDAADPATPLGAPSLVEEGFIHCTSGAGNLVATANRHYHDDPRDFVIVAVELDALTSPWRVEDPAAIYPHVLGRIDRAAIESVIPAPRDRDGTFQPFDA